MTAALALDPAKVSKFEPKGKLNTPDDEIVANVKANIRLGLPQIQVHPVNGQTAILVCGGASLKETERELVEAYWRGGKVIAVNGTYNWCIERNIRPSAMIMLDAREWNKRFLERDVPGCKYFLASQCHPASFEVCKNRETYIWHACSCEDKELKILNAFYFDRVHPITGGTTVGIRAIQLLRVLGFAWQEIFGLDSCWLNGEHHAYEQPENIETLVPVWLRPENRDDKAKRFECAPWHVRQATDFMNLVKARGDMFNLNVHGPGLIAEMLRTGAELQTEADYGCI